MTQRFDRDRLKEFFADACSHVVTMLNGSTYDLSQAALVIGKNHTQRTLNENGYGKNRPRKPRLKTHDAL